MRFLLLGLLLAASLLWPALTHAHELPPGSDPDAAGSSAEHAAADGIELSGSGDRHKWEHAAAKHRKALARQLARAEAGAAPQVSDQQLRQQVLLKTLGAPVSNFGDGSTGDSVVPPVSMGGNPYKVALASQSSMAARGAYVGPASDPATQGAWSGLICPTYDNVYGPGEDLGHVTPAATTAYSRGDPVVAGAGGNDPGCGPDARASTDPADTRYFSPNPRIVPVFEALMPDGKVLFWDWLVSGVMDGSGESANNESTRILLWDPADPNAPGERLDVIGANLFCAGFSHLPNGDLLLAGGNADTTMNGLKHTWIYHWRTKTWEKSQDMSRVRWYPSVASLSNGESLIVGGDPQIDTTTNGPGATQANTDFYQPGAARPEVFSSNYTNPNTLQTWNPAQPANHLRELTNLKYTAAHAWTDPLDPLPPSSRLYPFLFPGVDGRVLYAGAEPSMMLIDPRGQGGSRYFGRRDDGVAGGIVREYGASVYYGGGKVLVAGGGWPARYDGTQFQVQTPGPGFSTYDSSDPRCLGAGQGLFDEDDADCTAANWVCIGYSRESLMQNQTTEVWSKNDCIGNNVAISGAENQHGATATASKIDLLHDGAANSAQGLPTSKQAASMHYARRMNYLTVLPTGDVLATGGLSSTDADANPTFDATNASRSNELVNPEKAVFSAEMWNPATDKWSDMAPASVMREYHSTSLLLPDGRILNGGGGVCGPCYTQDYSEPNFQFYSPPYLFKSDGSPRSATERPRITTATVADGDGQVLPPVDYDDSFDVNYLLGDAGTTIKKAALIKLGAPTHGTDSGQRYVPLDFSQKSASTLTVKTPPNAYEAPPGFYMLFLVDSKGVPSIAKTVQVGARMALADEVTAATVFSGVNGLGNSQDLGLGAFSAKDGNLAQVGDNTIRSLLIQPNYHATVCRGDDFTDCAEVDAGSYTSLGIRFDRSISSIKIAEGSATTDPAITDLAATDTTPPVIQVTSPVIGSTTDNPNATLHYSVTDDIDESPSCNFPDGLNYTLQPGFNTATLGCFDDAGNPANVAVSITYVPKATPPPPTTFPQDTVKLKLAKKVKVSRKSMSVKVTCSAACIVAPQITGGKVRVNLKQTTLRGSKKPRVVKLPITKSVYKLVKFGLSQGNRVLLKIVVRSKAGTRVSAAAKLR